MLNGKGVVLCCMEVSFFQELGSGKRKAEEESYFPSLTSFLSPLFLSWRDSPTYQIKSSIDKLWHLDTFSSI